MKNSIILIMLLIFSVSQLNAQVMGISGKDSNKKQKSIDSSYASMGIIEIGGSAYLLGNFSSDYNYYSFSFYPGIRYFLVDKVHIDLWPGLGFSGSNGYLHGIYFSPTIKAGYTFPLVQKMFFDISGQFAYSLSIYEYGFFDSFGVGVSATLKFIIHNSSINLGLNYMYSFTSSWGVHEVSLTAGYSVFFGTR